MLGTGGRARRLAPGLAAAIPAVRRARARAIYVQRVHDRVRMYLAALRAAPVHARALASGRAQHASICALSLAT